MLDWSKHADSLLDHARLNWHMSAPVCLDILVTIAVEVGAVDDDLRPTMRVHRPKCHLEGKVPYHAVRGSVTVSTFERVLALAAFLTSR